MVLLWFLPWAFGRLETVTRIPLNAKELDAGRRSQ